MARCDKEPRKRKGEDGWETVPNEFVWWINDYRFPLISSRLAFLSMQTFLLKYISLGMDNSSFLGNAKL